jgi:hypothetical protein
MHSGIIDTYVHVTAVSMIPLWMSQLCRIFSPMIKNTLFMWKSDSAAHSTTVSLTPLWHA